MKTTPTSRPSREKRRWILILLKYAGAYLLGILLCILLTPADPVLAGTGLWPLYPLLAPVGFFLYYFYLTPVYVFGDATSYWLTGLIGLIPLAMEGITFFGGFPALRNWRPLWIGTPVGFLGTIGVYYTAAASI